MLWEQSKPTSRIFNWPWDLLKSGDSKTNFETLSTLTIWRARSRGLRPIPLHNSQPTSSDPRQTLKSSSVLTIVALSRNLHDKESAWRGSLLAKDNDNTPQKLCIAFFGYLLELLIIHWFHKSKVNGITASSIIHRRISSIKISKPLSLPLQGQRR